MIAKLDVSVIFKEHFATLRSQGATRCSASDVFVFLGIPVVVAVLIFYGDRHHLSLDGMNFLAAMFAIFIGLLLNLLVLIYSVLQNYNAKPLDDPGEDLRRRTLLRETFCNISYAVLISFLMLVMLFVARVSTDWLRDASVIGAYAIIGNFLLTLLMILKRVHTLLSKETASKKAP